MLSKHDIEESVATTLNGVASVVNNGSWVVDYLYRHKIGNKLPQGKRFNLFRGIENKHKWMIEIKDFNFQVESAIYANRLSPFLLSQITLLNYATIQRECCLNVGVVWDVIRMLEGDCRVAPSTELSKHKIAFSNNGILRNYKHSHVPMQPNAYLGMMAKSENLKRIANAIDAVSLTANLTIVENEIKSKGASKTGRMTGHWLITRTVSGKNYYLGVFPHSRGGADDYWIYEQVIESERYLSKRTKKFIS